jgi:hypothetical protein
MQEMKCLFSTVLALYYSIGLANADVTLVYGHGADTGEVPTPTHQVMIRDGQVAIANAADKRLLIFDSKAGSAWVVDHDFKEKTPVTAEGLEKLAARLMESQQRALAEIEKKMSQMSKEDREGLRPTLDMLQAAVASPEKLTAPAYRVEEVGHTEKFLGIEAKGAWLLKGDAKIAQTLLASPEAAGLKEEDRAALVGLSGYLERLTKGLPAMVRASLGLSGLIAPDGRLVLKSVPEAAGGSRMELLAIRSDAVEKGWFNAPADYAVVAMEVMVGSVSPPKAEEKK